MFPHRNIKSRVSTDLLWNRNCASYQIGAIQQQHPLQRLSGCQRKHAAFFQVQNHRKSKCEYSGWEKARHLATAVLNYPWGRGQWARRGGGEARRLLAPGSGQQVREDDDYQNTSRRLQPHREGVFLAHTAHGYRMGRRVDHRGGCTPMCTSECARMLVCLCRREKEGRSYFHFL